MFKARQLEIHANCYIICLIHGNLFSFYSQTLDAPSGVTCPGILPSPSVSHILQTSQQQLIPINFFSIELTKARDYAVR